jgi:hypothetical protein
MMNVTCEILKVTILFYLNLYLRLTMIGEHYYSMLNGVTE